MDYSGTASAGLGSEKEQGAPLLPMEASAYNAGTSSITIADETVQRSSESWIGRTDSPRIAKELRRCG